MSAGARVQLCLRCDRRAKGCNGPCPCTADPAGRTIHALARAGECPLGLFGNAVPAPQHEAGLTAAATIARGAAGLAKAALGIDRADPEIVAFRRRTCGGCPDVVLRLGVIQQCRRCGCGILPKTLVKGERCPAGRW